MAIFAIVVISAVIGATVGFEGGQGSPDEKNIFTSSYHSFTNDGE